jgi:aminoglycoside phosphotransferase (APT) family kinase protein
MKFSSRFKNFLSKRLKEEVIGITELAHGAHNINYTIRCKKGRYLLRVYVTQQFDNIDKEYKVLKLLDGRSAPRVLFKDKSKKYLKHNYLVEEFVEGKVKDSFSPKYLRLAADCLKEIHNIKRPTTMKVKPVSSWALRTLKNNNPSPHLKEDWPTLFKKACGYAEELLGSRSVKPTLIHDDPIAKNFIIAEEGLVLVDWEFATFDDPLGDLAVMIVEDKLSASHERILIDAYGIKQNQLKFVLGHKIKRCISCIAWRAERINMMERGHKHKSETVEEHIEYLRKEVDYLKKLLKRHFAP